MNILIICPYYLPTQTPRAFRWSSIISSLAEKGHYVHLVSSQNPSAKNSAIANLSIHRVGYLNIKEWLSFKSKNNSSKVERSAKEPILHKLAHTIWKNIYWPDGSFIWINAAKSKIRELQSVHNFDVMISVSLPFSSHLVGKAIKKQNPELKWIVDIGDPFSLQIDNPKNNLFLYKSRNTKNEQKILALADEISITSAELLNIYKNQFKIDSQKIHVIPPLLRTGFPQDIPIKGVVKGPLRFMYFGSFYSKIREPKKILEVFSLLKKNNLDFTLDFFGNYEHQFITQFSEYPELKDSLKIHGSIAPNRLIEKISEAHILVNLGNKYNFQIPSKLPEYIASSKPILNIIYDDKDSFKNALQDHPLIFNFSMAAPERLSQLIDFVTKNKTKHLTQDQKESLLKKYLLSSVFNQYENLLK